MNDESNAPSRYRGVWLALRILVVGWSAARSVAAVLGLVESPLLEGLRRLPAETALFLPLELLIAPITLAFVVGIQTLNPFSAEIWELPAWTQFPFSPRQPLQFFHLAGYVLLASGLGALAAAPWAQPGGLVYALLGVTSGLGTLLGVRVCVWIYPSKMRRPPPAEPEPDEAPR